MKTESNCLSGNAALWGRLAACGGLAIRHLGALSVATVLLAALPLIAQEAPPPPPAPPTPQAIDRAPLPPPAPAAPSPTPVAVPAPPPAPPLGWDIDVPMTAPAAVPYMPYMPDLPPMPVIAPMAPMPPMPPVAMSWGDLDVEPMLLAMGFPQDPDQSREARDQARAQADRARELARAQSHRGSDDSDYRRGSSYLERHDYDRAIDAFTRVVENHGDRADGALYWLAYAQNKLGKRDTALATIAELKKSYPQSRWIEDSKALEVEVRQASGQQVSPDAASDDEEMKLLALNSLMNSDPDRAIPLLEKIVKGSGNSPRIKERALFVLAQSRSPKARDLLAQIAKGGSNPDVQLKAIEYLGVHGSPENQQLLADVYKTSNDVEIKRAILRSFMISQNRDALLQAARNESNPKLRLEAIRQLGVMGGAAELYATESSFDGKRAILQGLMQSGDATKLGEIAKTEKDPKLRIDAIHFLGVMPRSKTGDALLTMYRQESDPSVKKEIINGLFIQQNAPALIDIARKETDASLKKEAVSRLSLMHSKEATDYMVELLNK